jgi:NAD(P)-dependent dehydrogenase (short-subunit alcohol dehydrogenase family)
MKSVLITGTNRGIGLELTRQYAQRDDVLVFAACRHPEEAAELQELAKLKNGKIVIVPLDVTNAEAIKQAVETVSQQAGKLDILLNNAGVDLPGREQSFEGITPEAMRSVYEINTIAPLMMTLAFTDLLKKSSRAQNRQARVVNFTSEMGSITQRDYGDNYAYCASKAALNMTTRGLAVDLRGENIICIALDPGWVKTDMGGGAAPLKPEEAVSGILSVVDQLSEKDSGTFLQWNGGTLPW